MKLLFCNNFYIETIRNKMKREASFRELVQENFSQKPGYKGILKQALRREQRGSLCKSILYGKKVVDVLSRHTEAFLKEEGMQLQTSERERVLHSMHTTSLTTLDGRVRQRVLQTLQIK